MPKTRPPDPAEFRDQMVEPVQAGRTPAELSREFGVTAQSIAAWAAQAAANSGKPARGKDVLSSAERDELMRLRRENKRLQQERDILAKATPGSPPRATRRPSGLRTREREPGQRSRACDVPRAQCLPQAPARSAGRSEHGFAFVRNRSHRDRQSVLNRMCIEAFSSDRVVSDDWREALVCDRRGGPTSPLKNRSSIPRWTGRPRAERWTTPAVQA
jgi:transposase